MNTLVSLGTNSAFFGSLAVTLWPEPFMRRAMTYDDTAAVLNDAPALALYPVLGRGGVPALLRPVLGEAGLPSPLLAGAAMAFSSVSGVTDSQRVRRSAPPSAGAASA